MTQSATNIAEGYLEDAQGRLVPVGSIRPIDLARDDLVREKIAKIKAMQQELRDLKYELLGDIEAFVSMSAERYDVSIGGKKGNVTLASYDGRYTLKRQISENLTFDEGLQAAKAIIDDCLRAWTKDSAEEIRTLVDFAFQVDKEGCLNTGRILALRRLDIKDEQWRRAMDAISDSLQVSGTVAYVRAYERDANGRYQALSLDMAAL